MTETTSGIDQQPENALTQSPYQSVADASRDLKREVLMPELFDRFNKSKPFFKKELEEGQTERVVSYLFQARENCYGTGPFLSFFRENLEILDQTIDSGKNLSPTVLVVAAYLAAGVMKDDETIYREDYDRAAEFIKKHLNSMVSHYLNNPKKANPPRLLAEVIGALPRSEATDITDNLITQALFEKAKGRTARNLVMNLSKYEYIYSVDHVEQIVGPYLKSLGLDEERVLQAWRNAHKQVGGYQYDKHPFEALCALEDKEPGAVKVLNEEFGINNFNRYPIELLIKQYQERSINTKPSGIVIHAETDWNGAFLENEKHFRKLGLELADYSIRFYEVKSIPSLVHTLNRNRHRYGPAEFLILGGHGSEAGIELGRGSAGQVYQADTQLKGASALELAFVKNPTVILISCSTGKLGGIGQSISELGQHGATVIAPSIDGNLKKIDVVVDENGKPNFSVEYYGGSRMIYTAGTPNKPV
jgi:hypothetical protein